MKRRNYLRNAGILFAASQLPSVARGANASGSDEIKLALVGCGGRGRGALMQRLAVNDNVRVVAIADIFEAGARSAVEVFEQTGDKRFDLKDGVFFGLDAYKKAIELCDSVILATPPGFRPVHFAYAVNAGKQIFMEKPCAIDARGFRMVQEAARIADEKNLKVVCGFQRHYQNPYLGMFEQIKEGKIGQLKYSRVYWNQGNPTRRPRLPGMTEMQYQVKCWYPFNWITGDNIVEQHCHNIDVGNWIHSLGDPTCATAHPVKCNGMGGREVRKYPRYLYAGNRYDHFCCEFTYADGTQMFSQCRHQEKCWFNVSETFVGTEGAAGCGWVKNLNGETIWKFQGEDPDPYKNEHVYHAKFIREDIAHNDAWFASNSSMTSVLGRYAAYSGAEISWDDAVANGVDEFPYDLIAEVEANDPTKFWDVLPPTLPDSFPPAQPGAGEFIYENSVPVPGEWNWRKA